jgi:hypothetical protein
MESLITNSEQGKSAAIWFKAKLAPDGGVASANIHFNFWRNSAQKRKSTLSDFLDIGVLITNTSALESVCVFLPFKVDPDGIEDLGHLFAQAKIAIGVFNEGLICQSGARPRTFDLIRESNREHYCRIFSFKDDSDGIQDGYIEYTEEGGGTILTITSSALSQAAQNLTDGQKTYFRLRVNLPPLNPFVRIIAPEDRWLLSGFESVEYTDFRINEARNLSEAIERLASKGARVPITRVDFLLVVGVAADVTGGHKNFHKCRLLERELWDAYYDNGRKRAIPEGMVIYHWKEAVGSESDVKEISDFGAFVKFRRRHSQIATYVWIALGLGAIGGVGGNALWALGIAAIGALKRLCS